MKEPQISLVLHVAAWGILHGAEILQDTPV